MSVKVLFGQRKGMYLVLAVGLLVFPVISLAGITTFASIDTMLGNIYARVRNKDQVKKLPESMEKGNIYQDAYKIASDNITRDNVGAIEKTTQYINTSYAPGCNLTTADTNIILYQNKQIRQVMGDLLEVPAPMLDPELFYDRFYNSCMSLHACLDPKGDYKNRAGLKTCVEAASTAFYLTRQHQSNFDAMDQSTYGDNVYIDGDPDNSMFDLLVDIEVIGDVLFEDNKPTPEIVFFEMPSLIKPSDSGDGSDAGAGDSDDDGSGTDSGDADDENAGSSSSSSSSSGDGDDAGIDDDLKDFFDGTQEGLVDTLVGDGPLALGNPCVLTGDDDSQAGPDLPSADDIVNNLHDIYTELLIQQNALLDGVEPALILDDEGDADLGNPGDPDINARQCALLSRERSCDDRCGSIVDAAQRTACYQDCCDPQESTCSASCDEESDARGKELCEVNCCTQSCDIFDGSDKLVCMSECLCGEVVGPENPGTHDRAPQIEYRVRFCRVPVQVQSIVPKRVFTVEGVLNEINIILTALKESGQLMKHVKTKEMFETSMQKVKFADILSFNFFFSLKPIFDVVPKAEIEEEREQDNSDREKTIRGMGGDLQIKAERNKYVLVHNAPEYDAAYGVATDYTTQMNAVADMAEKMSLHQVDNSHLTEVATAKVRALVGTEVADFIGNNAAFWHEVNESMILMNDMAYALKMKVEDD